VLPLRPWGIDDDSLLPRWLFSWILVQIPLKVHPLDILGRIVDALWILLLVSWHHCRLVAWLPRQLAAGHSSTDVSVVFAPVQVLAHTVDAPSGAVAVFVAAVAAVVAVADHVRLQLLPPVPLVGVDETRLLWCFLWSLASTLPGMNLCLDLLLETLPGMNLCLDLLLERTEEKDLRLGVACSGFFVITVNPFCL